MRATASFYSMTIMVVVLFSALSLISVRSFALPLESDKTNQPEKSSNLINPDTLSTLTNHISDKPLLLDKNIKEFLDREVRSISDLNKRAAHLHELLFQPWGYHIRYDASHTNNAKDTFYLGRGNCMSLANLYVAAARYVGLRANFQVVSVDHQWIPNGDLYEIPQHINVIVSTYDKRIEIEFNRRFYDGIRGRIKRKKISDREAKAHYFNNIAVDFLTQNKLEAADLFFRKAINEHEKLDFIWSNLGVTLRRAGQLGEAEGAYKKALKLNKRNLSALSNAYVLYKHQGRKVEAKLLEARVEKYARKNPYYLDKIANQFIEAGDYSSAIEYGLKAIKRYKLEPDFHFHLAIAYFYNGQIDASRESLKRARDLSESEEYKNRFQRKLDAFAAIPN